MTEQERLLQAEGLRMLREQGFTEAEIAELDELLARGMFTDAKRQMQKRPPEPTAEG